MKHLSRGPALPIFLLTVGPGLGLAGCNDDSDGLSVNGTWTGEVSEVQFQITLMVTERENKRFEGLADVDSPLAGTVQGEVVGVRAGTDVTFTIELDDDVVAGSLLFEGVLRDGDTMTGTLDGGLLGGTFPVTFQRQL